MSEFITLRGGLTVPAAVLAFAVDLEQRGFAVRTDAQGLRVRAPVGQTLTAAERTFVQTYKAHLLALVTYVAEVPEKEDDQHDD